MKKPRPRKYDRGWRVNFEHPRGVRHQIRFPDRSYPDARQAAEDYIDAVLGGKPADRETLTATIRIYLNWAERSGQKTSKTVASDHQRLTAFADWARTQKVISPRDITLDHIREFQAWFFDNFPLYKNRRRRYIDGLEPEELQRRRLVNWDKYRLALSAFLYWCESREYVKRNVIAGAKEFKIKRQQRLEFRIYTPDELELLWAWFDGREDPAISAFYRLLAYTGMRVGEVRALRWPMVDLEAGIIRVATKTKSKKVRSVRMSDKLRPYLEELRKRSKGRTDYVFADGQGGKKYQHCNWYRLLRQALDELELEPGRLHDFRHTFGASLAQQGVPIATISELMGHASIETTMIYVHFAPKHLKAAIEKLPY